MKPLPSPQAFADKWQRRTAAAQPDYVAGVKAVNQSPAQAAIAQKELLRQKLLQSLDDGTWENALGGVSLQAWQDATSGKGAQRLGAGVQGATAKVTTMAQKLMPAIAAAVADANATPRGDLEANIQRSATFARSMAKNAPRRTR